MSSVLSKCVSFAVVAAGISVLACGGNNAVPQGIIASNVQPNGASTGTCGSPEKFIYIPESADIPGPNTDVSSNIVQTATGDVLVSCSVVPSTNGGFDVSLTANITGGVSPGTLNISGHFTARGRDTSGGDAGLGKPNADGTTMPNINGDFLDETKHLKQANCFAQYVHVDNGEPGTPLPDEADTFADDKGGKIWASIFCGTPQQIKSGAQGNDACKTSATFRFENCTSKGSN